MNPGETSYDVFLSHSHDDADEVEYFAKRLEDEFNFRVWLDKWILVPGKSWQAELSKGLSTTKCCAVFIGRKTPDGWFRQEVERALDRQAKDAEFRVLAVLLPGANFALVDEFLGLRSWVDFRDGVVNESQFHLFVSAIRGVAPGRGPKVNVVNDEYLNTVKENLSKIKILQNEGLIEKEIAIEYQRKLLDGLMKVAM